MTSIQCNHLGQGFLLWPSTSCSYHGRVGKCSCQWLEQLEMVSFFILYVLQLMYYRFLNMGWWSNNFFSCVRMVCIKHFTKTHSEIKALACVFSSFYSCLWQRHAFCGSYIFKLPSACGEGNERNGSSEEEVDVNNFIDPQAEDQELKGQLLRRYSGYLGSLKQEFMKKRKKGKLPKEARQQLLDWWSRHYKWPYPSVCIYFNFINAILDPDCMNSCRLQMLSNGRCLARNFHNNTPYGVISGVNRNHKSWH